MVTAGRPRTSSAVRRYRAGTRTRKKWSPSVLDRWRASTPSCPNSVEAMASTPTPTTRTTPCTRWPTRAGSRWSPAGAGCDRRSLHHQRAGRVPALRSTRNVPPEPWDVFGADLVLGHIGRVAACRQRLAFANLAPRSVQYVGDRWPHHDGATYPMARRARARPPTDPATPPEWAKAYELITDVLPESGGISVRRAPGDRRPVSDAETHSAQRSLTSAYDTGREPMDSVASKVRRHRQPGRQAGGRPKAASRSGPGALLVSLTQGTRRATATRRPGGPGAAQPSPSARRARAGPRFVRRASGPE